MSNPRARLVDARSREGRTQSLAYDLLPPLKGNFLPDFLSVRRTQVKGGGMLTLQGMGLPPKQKSRRIVNEGPAKGERHCDACCFWRLGEKGDNRTEGEMSGGYGGSGERVRR